MNIHIDLPLDKENKISVSLYFRTEMTGEMSLEYDTILLMNKPPRKRKWEVLSGYDRTGFITRNYPYSRVMTLDQAKQFITKQHRDELIDKFYKRIQIKL